MLNRLFKKPALSGYSQSRMSPFDEHALNLLLHGKRDMNILEIGSWLGAGSTQIFSRYAKRLVCVDHWKGNTNPTHQNIVKEADPLAIFIKNTQSFREKVVPILSDSSAIGDLLAERHFDFVFIDGDHRYHQTIIDINNCVKKVRPGGTIAGHDCEARLEELNGPFSEDDLNKDHIDSPIKKFVHCHPGVITAVKEKFGNDVSLFADDLNRITLPDGRSGHSTIWYKTL